jgi:hypothetical protein
VSTPTVFRKKPVQVEAMQWTGSNEAELVEFTDGRFIAIDPADFTHAEGITARVYDVLHSTWVGLHTGQWVIKGIAGEFYPIAEDVLRETYERVTP